MNYPKVLIVGQYFNKLSGGAITMTNLFQNWDKNNIAVVAENIHNPDFSICTNYYQLGSMEIKRKFPFNLNAWSKKIQSGNIFENENLVNLPSNPKIQNSKISKIKYAYLHFLFFTGLYFYKRRFKISYKFLNWIEAFSPDIIYTQLSNIELIDLVEDLRTQLKLPIAIHIMDDWPTTISQQGPFHDYWFKIIDKKFRYLLSNSKVLMGISESMREEYKKRYRHNFIPFHNPIDIKSWSLYSKKGYQLNKTFTILYAGRVGLGIENCFFDIADAIETLVHKGLKIEFHLLTNNHNEKIDELRKFNFIKLKGAVPYSEMPKIFSESDLLLLPNDFDSKSIAFLRYSMPTKASEYMISGTPILLYSSTETAVTSHALKYKWAYIVSEQNKKLLETAIEELYNNEELRSKLGSVARKYAINNYNGVMIREQFKKSLDPREIVTTTNV